MIGRYIYRRGFGKSCVRVLASKILTGDLSGGGDYDSLGRDHTARARQITKWWTDMDWDLTEEDGDDGNNRQWQIHRDKIVAE